MASLWQHHLPRDIRASTQSLLTREQFKKNFTSVIYKCGYCLRVLKQQLRLPYEQSGPRPSPIFAILFIETEQICSIPEAQIPYSAYK